ASQVGLSHSTQARKPCSMVSESKGRLAGFMMGPPGWAGMFGFDVGLLREGRQRVCKGKTWRLPAFPARVGHNGNSGSIFELQVWRSRVGGADPGLKVTRRQAQAGRKRTCPEGCPDFCLSAGVTSVVGSKGVVKLNIDPIVRSETGQGPE